MKTARWPHQSELKLQGFKELKKMKESTITEDDFRAVALMSRGHPPILVAES